MFLTYGTSVCNSSNAELSFLPCMTVEYVLKSRGCQDYIYFILTPEGNLTYRAKAIVPEGACEPL